MSALLDSRYFPSYKQLPDEYDLIDVPSHHWCFMGEIEDDSMAKASFLRHRLVVKDRDGAQVQVTFYLDNTEVLDTSKLKKGNTIFVRYAVQHAFVDGSEGLRIEDTTTFYVVSHSLKRILEVHEAIRPSVCRKCGRQASQRCAKCKQAFYCSRECQTENWSDHKKGCRILTAVAPVTALEMTPFTEFVSFP